MVQILFENPLLKCREKNILLGCVHYAHAGKCVTALHVITCFAEKYFFATCLGTTNLFMAVEKSKDITHVKSLQSLEAKISNVLRM